MKNKNRKTQLFIFILILVGYLIADYCGEWLSYLDPYKALNEWIKHLIKYFLQVSICFFFTLIIIKYLKSKSGIFEHLGLNRSILQGLITALWVTLPMLIGYAVIAPINPKTTLLDIIFWAVISGFAEEILFRGYFFGLLFRKLQVGFFPSILLVSIIFGLGHIYQGNDLMSTLGVFVVTFIGSVFFAWLYIEWDYNLWLVIGLHILMNLYWMLFDLETSTALGGWGANIFRFLAIIVAVILTIRKIKKQGKGSLLKGKAFKLIY